MHIILSIDDNPGDQDLMDEVIKSNELDYEIQRAKDGSDALRKLNELYSKNALPGLILCDINMPGLNGYETIDIIQNDERLLKIPLLIFTTTRDSKESLNKKGIISFIKPSTINDFEKVFLEILMHFKKMV